jgi:hypothetical protein
LAASRRTRDHHPENVLKPRIVCGMQLAPEEHLHVTALFFKLQRQQVPGTRSPLRQRFRDRIHEFPD